MDANGVLVAETAELLLNSVSVRTSSSLCPEERRLSSEVFGVLWGGEGERREVDRGEKRRIGGGGGGRRGRGRGRGRQRGTGGEKKRGSEGDAEKERKVYSKGG